MSYAMIQIINYTNIINNANNYKQKHSIEFSIPKSNLVLLILLTPLIVAHLFVVALPLLDLHTLVISSLSLSDPALSVLHSVLILELIFLFELVIDFSIISRKYNGITILFYAQTVRHQLQYSDKISHKYSP